jgi:hypothetical protein
MAEGRPLDTKEAHARLDRLNTWVAELHKRIERIERHMGLPPWVVPNAELLDEALDRGSER